MKKSHYKHHLEYGIRESVNPPGTKIARQAHEGLCTVRHGKYVAKVRKTK